MYFTPNIHSSCRNAKTIKLAINTLCQAHKCRSLDCIHKRMAGYRESPVRYPAISRTSIRANCNSISTSSTPFARMGYHRASAISVRLLIRQRLGGFPTEERSEVQRAEALAASASCCHCLLSSSTYLGNKQLFSSSVNSKCMPSVSIMSCYSAYLFLYLLRCCFPFIYI